MINCTDSKEFYDLLAKHILLNLNGLILVDTVKSMFLAGEKLTNDIINKITSAIR